MRMVVFDQATQKSGWALLVNGVYKESGVIDLQKNHDADDRLRQMMAAICHKIDEAMPDIVVIEDVQNQTSPKTFKMLQQLQGAIMMYCHEYEYELKILHSSTWRQLLEFDNTSRKRAYLKLQAKKYVAEHFGKNLPEDEADAVCIGCAALKAMKERK